MLSSEIVSVETSVTKAEPIGARRAWVLMFAGSPTPVADLILGIKEKLEGLEETEKEVRTAAQAVYQELIRKKVEDEILSPFGVDRETFIKRGRG